MGGNHWFHCEPCRQAHGDKDWKSYYHPGIALYARPPGSKGMVRVGWLLRCGHVQVTKNPAEALK